MADEVARLVAAVEANTSAAVANLRAFDRALQSSANDADKHVGRISSGFSGILSTATGVMAGFAGFKAIGGIFDGIGSSIVGFNSNLQNAQIAFTTMLGSGEKATAMLQDFQKFAALTPFRFEDLTSASQRLLAFGFAAQDLLPTMKSIGDALANMGNVGEEGIQRVSIALGQMATAGKINARDMMQLTEAGIPAWRILADATGKTTAQIQKMSEDGLLPADKNLKLLIEGMEKNAPNAMQKMEHTWSGATSNIQDSFQQLIAGGFRPLFDALTEGANRLAAFMATPKVQAFAREVSTALQFLGGAIGAVFGGDGPLGKGIDRAGALFSEFVERIKGLGLAIVAGIAGAVESLSALTEPVATLFINLVTSAAEWGANLLISFTTGMVEGAAATLTAGLTAIGNLIGDFLESFSPPKKGPLSQIDVWGANLLNTYFEGFSKADFGVFDTLGKTIQDALQSQMQAGAFPEEGLIPRLVGSQAMVAQAIAEMRDFGKVSEDTIGRLDALLGDSSDAIQTVLRDLLDLADTQRQLDGVNQTIDDLNKQLDNLDRSYQREKRDIEDTIKRVSARYDIEIKKIDEVIGKLEARRRLVLGDTDAELASLSAQEKQDRLASDREELAKAQNAHTERGAKLQDDIADKQSRILEIQRDIAAEQAKGAKASPERLHDLGVRLAREQADLQATQNDLAKGGAQTAEDRLRIDSLRIRVLEDERAIQTASLDADIEREKSAKELLKAEQDLDPELQAQKDALLALNEQHDTAKRGIEDQLSVQQDQKTALEAQVKTQQIAVDTVQARLGHERDVSDELQKQLDLLNKQILAAEAAAEAAVREAEAAARKAEAERKRQEAAAKKAAKLAGGGDISKGLGLKPIELPKAPDFSNIKFDTTEMEKRVKESFGRAFDNVGAGLTASFKKQFAKIDWKDALPEGIGAIAGGVLGAAIGGPVGAAVGVALGAALGKVFSNAFKGLPPILATAVAAVPFAGILAAPFLALPALFTQKGRDIAGGLLDGMRDRLGRFADWVGENFQPGVVALGHLLEGMVSKVRDDVIPAFLRAIQDAAGDIAHGLATWGALFIDWIKPRIGPMLEALGGLLKNIGSWITGTALPEIAGGLADWGRVFAAWAGPASQKALSALGDLAGKIGDGIVTNAPIIAGKFAAWGEALVGWVAPRIGPALIELGKLLASIGEWVVTTGVPTLAGKLAEWGAAFVGWVGPKIPVLLGALGDLLLKVGGWIIDTALPAIGEKLVEWGKAFVAWVGPQIEPMIGEMGKWLNRLGEWIVDEAIPFAVKHLSTFGLLFVAWVATDALPTLVAKLWEWGNKIGDWLINDALPFAVEKLAKFAGPFVDWITHDVIPSLPGRLKDITGTIGAWIFGTAIPWAVDNLAKFAGPFIDWITHDVIPGLPGRLKDILGEIGKWLLNDAIPWATRELKKLGQAVLDGIWQGILDGWGGFFTSLKNKLQSLPGDVKDALTKSPWDDFAPLGVAAVDGVILGLEAQMPALIDALKLMGDTMIDEAEQIISDVQSTLASPPVFTPHSPVGSAAMSPSSRVTGFDPQAVAMFEHGSNLIAMAGTLYDRASQLERDASLIYNQGVMSWDVSQEEALANLTAATQMQQQAADLQARAATIAEQGAAFEQEAAELNNKAAGIQAASVDTQAISTGTFANGVADFDSAVGAFAEAAMTIASSGVGATLGPGGGGGGGEPSIGPWQPVPGMPGAFYSVVTWPGGGKSTSISTVGGVDPMAAQIQLQQKGLFYAAGTPSAAPGWAWTGEEGPELVKFRGGEQVLSHQDSLRALTGPSSGGYQTEPIDYHALGEAVAEAMDRRGIGTPHGHPLVFSSRVIGEAAADEFNRQFRGAR
jgi:tape measure domain-containing protein